MFVCVCKGIRKSDIEAIAKAGKGKKAIAQITGAGSDCGTCVLRLQQILRDIEVKADSDPSAESVKDIAG